MLRARRVRNSWLSVHPCTYSSTIYMTICPATYSVPEEMTPTVCPPPTWRIERSSRWNFCRLAASCAREGERILSATGLFDHRSSA